MEVQWKKKFQFSYTFEKFPFQIILKLQTAGGIRLEMYDKG